MMKSDITLIERIVDSIQSMAVDCTKTIGLVDNILDRLDETQIELGDETYWYGNRLVINKDTIDDGKELSYKILCAYIKNTIILTLMINSNNSELLDEYYKSRIKKLGLRSLSDIKITPKDSDRYIKELINDNIYPHENFRLSCNIDECVIFDCRLDRLYIDNKGLDKIMTVGAVNLVYNFNTHNIESTNYITSKGNNIRSIIEAKNILNSLVY